MNCESHSGHNNHMNISQFIEPKTSRRAFLVLTGVLGGLMQSTLNLPWLAFFVFAPMVHCLSACHEKKAFRLDFLCFFAPYYLIQLTFMLTIWKICPLPPFAAIPLAVLAWLGLALWECILMYLPLSIFLPVRSHLKHRLSEIVLFCLLCTAGEWLQEKTPFLAFPWSAAWLTVTSSPLLLQSANLINCRLTSFIIFLLNGLHGEIYTGKKRFAYTAFALLLQGANLSYGLYSVNLDKKLDDIYPQIDVICAQDSLEGRDKSRRRALDSARSYLSIMKSCWRWGTDLVLLPETAVPKDYDEQLDEFTLISDFAAQKGCTVVTGSFYLENGCDYNALFAFDESGKAATPYLKQVLVPFGEKTPFAGLFHLDTMSECTDERYTKPLTSDGMTIGPVICIESIFPSLVSSQKEQGAQLICVSTNDSWFGKSSAREQHYRHCIMRAVENRRYVLRAGNCGISAIISPAGEQLSVKSDKSKGAVWGKVTLIGR